MKSCLILVQSSENPDSKMQEYVGNIKTNTIFNLVHDVGHYKPT